MECVTVRCAELLLVEAMMKFCECQCEMGGVLVSASVGDASGNLMACWSVLRQQESEGGKEFKFLSFNLAPCFEGTGIK